MSSWKKRKKTKTQQKKTNKPIKSSQNVDIVRNEPSNLNVVTNAPPDIVVSVTAIDTQVHETISERLINFYRRINPLTKYLFVLCVLGLVAMYFFCSPFLLFGILVSFVFAGGISYMSACFNQRRFHYKILLLNEASTRFISVLASFILGKIVIFGETPAKDIIPSIIVAYCGFFIVASIFNCISIYLTNRLKNHLLDTNRHECKEKTRVYRIVPVVQDEGLGQKVCANASGAEWLLFRKELDQSTNRNVQIFLTFLLLTVGLFIAISLFPKTTHLNVPPVPLTSP